MTNEERPVSISPPAQQPPAPTSSRRFLAQDRHASVPAQTARGNLPARKVRGNLATVSDAGDAGFSSGFSSALSVELHIEELVLHGFPAGDRYRIGDALERELTRLLTEQGAPTAIAQSGEIAHLNAGAFQVKTGANPETTGVQLAQAIYGGLRR